MNGDRASRASGHIFDQHGVHAEWCRLKGPPEQNGVQRGFWYRIRDFEVTTDIVTVDAEGGEQPVACSLLKLRKDVPEKATVFNASTFGPPDSEMVYAAGCPKRHRIDHVNLTDDKVHCGECARDYEWEWERE